MGFLNLYLIMAIAGYVTFVFIAETLNPFVPHKMTLLRKRHFIGLLAGLLIALSALVAKFIPTNGLIGEIKASIAASLLLMLPLMLYLLCTTLLNRTRFSPVQRVQSREEKENRAESSEQSIRHKKVRRSAAIFDTPRTQDVKKMKAVNLKDSALGNESPMLKSTFAKPGVITLDATTAIMSTDNPNQFSDNELSDSELAQLSIDPLSADTDMYNFDNVELTTLTDTKESNTSTSTSTVATSQAVKDTEADLELQLPEELRSKGLESGKLKPERASFNADKRLSKLSNKPTQNSSDIVADDLTDPFLVAWDEDKSELTPIDNKSSFDPAITDTIPISSLADTKTSLPNSELEAAVAAAPDAQEADRLVTTLYEVENQADAIQSSISKIHNLSQEEHLYRQQLRNAQVSFDNAQRLQIEQQGIRLTAGEQLLDDALRKKMNAETELSQQKQNIVNLEVRVLDLEVELRERQRVFADQVESLKKTREMARHAALLARKAATAQQNARTQVLQERAARERLEVSAKKAVNIARNAISKLAQEERKNKEIHH